jgi:hypothetical protein
MFESTLNYESHFFISGQDGSPPGTELSGVSSLDIGYQNASNITNILGYQKGVTTIGGRTAQNVSLSRYLIYDDPVLDFTGATEVMKGSFNYNNNASYGFESGYLTSYSVNCAVGSIPKVNASIIVYDELLSGINASGTNAQAIYIPSQGSITATCDNSTTNRVIGFDYALEVLRKPYYTIGSETPVQVKYIPPIKYSASVQIEVDDIFLESGYNFLTTGKEEKTVSFVINGRDGTSLQSLTIPKASLVNEQLSASADGSVRLTLNYAGHS